tara:strand:- start:1423 stop:1611 length:189 start_codon:yes stop_codon:yes gene_type:complete
MTAKESLLKYYLIRCEALEKKISELQDCLKLDNENKRMIVTQLEVELDKYKQKENRHEVLAR